MVPIAWRGEWGVRSGPSLPNWKELRFARPILGGYPGKLTVGIAADEGELCYARSSTAAIWTAESTIPRC
jgi:hypothetical protein